MLRRALTLPAALVCLALPLAAVGGEEAAPASAGASAQPAGVAAAKPVSVEAGRKVSIEYTLTLDDGNKADSNVGGEPLIFEQGAHQILPALEEALAGMKVSESRKVTLTPDKGYGEVMPQLIQEVDPQQIPEEARVAGTELAAEDEQGNRHFARVHEVREDKILVDMTHPLAGKTLHFDVKILAID
jgi:FKBP-type peptidyl-prolyl cis-trans isomerase 2